MADQDKDRINPTMGQQASPGVPGSDPSSTSQQKTSGTKSSASNAMPARADTQDGSTDATRRVMDEAKDTAKDMAGRAKEQGQSMLERQKDSAAGQVDSAANAFRTTAEQLQGQGQPQAGRYVSMFAEQLESLGGQLRDKNMDTLIRDAEDLGRRSPGVFLAGSVVAGFVLARFLKSSATHRHGQAETSHKDWRSDSARTGDRSGTMSNAYGTSSSDMDSAPFSGQSSSAGSAGTTAGSAGGGLDSASNADRAKTVSGAAGSSTSATSNATSKVGADGTGAADKTTPPSTSTSSKPGGNTYGNR